MDTLFHQPLFYILFIYGASFLVMAYAIIRGIRRATSMVLVTTFQTLAAFGLTHGIREMLVWLSFIFRTTGHAEITWVSLISSAFRIVSYVILLQFAINLLSYRSERKAIYRLIPGLLVVAGIIALVVTGTYDANQIGLYARRTFGFTGALLSGVALGRLAVAMRTIRNTRVECGLLLGAVGFFAYAAFGGLIVSTPVSQPVQIFRALYALLIAVSSTLILGIFRQGES
jgi:hypothetical protein